VEDLEEKLGRGWRDLEATKGRRPPLAGGALDRKAEKCQPPFSSPSMFFLLPLF